MNEIVDYMIERFKKDRHIPKPDELLEKFPRARWIDIVNAGHHFNEWHTVWTSERA